MRDHWGVRAANRLARAVLAMMTLGILLLIINGIVGAGLTFGSPADRRVLSVLAIVGIAVGMALLLVANYLWQRARMRDPLHPRYPWVAR